jgi:hypothetical protein
MVNIGSIDRKHLTYFEKASKQVEVKFEKIECKTTDTTAIHEENSIGIINCNEKIEELYFISCNSLDDGKKIFKKFLIILKQAGIDTALYKDKMRECSK